MLLNNSEDFQKCRLNKLKKPWRQNAMASFFTTNYSKIFIANECCINSQDGTQIVYDFMNSYDLLLLRPNLLLFSAIPQHSR